MDERELGELSAKLTALAETVRDFRDDTRQWQQALDLRLASYSHRIQKVEHWRAWVTGALALLGVLWASMFAWMKR